MNKHITKTIKSISEGVDFLNNNDNNLYCNIILLHHDDKFKDGDEVAILSLNDFKKFEILANESESKDEEIKNLKREISKLNNILDDDDYALLPEKLSEHTDQLFALQDKVNQRNEMLFEVNNYINQTIEEAIVDTVKETNELVKANNKTNRAKINNAIDQTEKEVTENNRAMASEINNAVKNINEEFHNISLWKLLRNRKNIDIKIPTSDLNKQVNIKVSNNIIEDKEVNVDVLKIKNNHKSYDLKQLWIDTNEKEDKKEPINIKSKDKD